jgi:hypothetical protein
MGGVNGMSAKKTVQILYPPFKFSDYIEIKKRGDIRKICHEMQAINPLNLYFF